ncbi:MAG: FHIPEP family type III secretion protein [Williamsia sp.]|nr:FHIPEP family type III secretion protein [Williamsia sp.]
MNLFNNIFENIREEKELYFELGRTLLKQSKFRKAIEYLEEAKNTEGEASLEWETSYLLGECFRNLSKPKDAFMHYVEAAVNTEEYKEQCYEKARELLSANNAGEANKWLKELDAKAPWPLQELDRLHLENLADHTALLIRTNQEERGASTPTDTREEIQRILAEVNELISKREYKNALKKTEEALTKDPTHAEVIFVKLRVLVEGQLDTGAAATLLNDPDYGYRKQHPAPEIINRLVQLQQQEPGDGNIFFFSAFTAQLLGQDAPTSWDWMEKARIFGLKNENEYPLLGWYLLAAELAEKMEHREEAAINYFETGKCYYWLGNNPSAKKYFEQAIRLDPDNAAVYPYYADILFVLSYQNDPPYYNREMIFQAFDCWNRGDTGLVRTTYDAWHYIVIARIHEILYKFAESEAMDDLWKSVWYMEKAVQLDPSDFSLWAYLGHFYRNLELEALGMAAFQKAASFGKDDLFLKEETIILELNAGLFENAKAYLLTLKAAPATYKAYHKSWDGYITYHESGDYGKALSLFDEVIREDEKDLFAHQMKLFCYWQGGQLKEAEEEAHVILEQGRKYTYLKEEYTFAWAHFVAGDPYKAIELLETADSSLKPITDNLISLIQFYVYTGSIDKAETAFTALIKDVSNKKAVREFKKSLDALLHQFRENQVVLPGSAEPLKSAAQLESIAAAWKSRLVGKLDELDQHPWTVEIELKKNLVLFENKPDGISTQTLQAALSRIFLNKPSVLYPVVTPIAVEISNDLVTAGAEAPDWYVVKKLIPQMKERILQQYGIPCPGVRIRGNEGDLGAGTYIISLDEVPLVMGKVQQEKLFVYDAGKNPAIEEPTGEKGWNPLTGQDSWWVSREHKPLLLEQGILFWEDPFDYILAHLEVVLSNNLSLFVDAQFCSEYLKETGSEKGPWPEEAEKTRTDPASLILFNQVLKNLVIEKVSVTDKPGVIRAFIQGRPLSSDLNDLVQHIRLAGKEWLEVNRREITAIELPADIETTVREHILTEGKNSFLALPAEVCQEILEHGRNFINKNRPTGPVYLLTNDLSIRIHLRKLFELEFPDLMVYAQQELLEKKSSL